MAKTMWAALLMVVAIEIAVALMISCVPGGDVVCENKTSLFSFLLNPQDWSTSGFTDLLQNDLFLIGGTTLVLVGATFLKNDFIIYAGIAGVFFGFGQTLYSVWQALYSTQLFGDLSAMVATMIVAVPALIFVMAVMDFARGRD